ncbi:uncharacterized protein EV422DRAFT_565561 [Fimicolochytrium jonesii]|uniref:uncharacterized protein n=1 Tax=Fimicolochytrium jonesii TaxID=1396493 RepID=UPI0022FE7FB0|nr:uncharacterized protein EV422DRAFT_565561 [Fimicolochytrium jonesii]KAI8823624.1 hypothetical protein EV422DRAFT_565561 [Fimicolochytrium jonesii]
MPTQLASWCLPQGDLNKINLLTQTERLEGKHQEISSQLEERDRSTSEVNASIAQLNAKVQEMDARLTWCFDAERRLYNRRKTIIDYVKRKANEDNEDITDTIKKVDAKRIKLHPPTGRSLTSLNQALRKFGDDWDKPALAE